MFQSQDLHALICFFSLKFYSYYTLLQPYGCHFIAIGAHNPCQIVHVHCAVRRCLPYVVTCPTHCASRRCCMPYGDMSPVPVSGMLWIGCLLHQIRFMLLTLVLYTMSSLVYSWLSGWIVYFHLVKRNLMQHCMYSTGYCWADLNAQVICRCSTI